MKASPPLLVLFAAPAFAASTAAAEPERPNVLVVHCHDLGQFLHCYGVKTVQTPNVDRLAAEGVRFARSFCTAPGCSPSRASIFTGRWPHSNGVMGLCHANFAWDLNPAERHLGQILREAGYATAAVGIIHETSSGFERCGYERHLRQASAAPATDAAIGLVKEFAAKPERPFFLSVGFIEPHRLSYREPDWPGALPGDNSFPGPALEPDDSLGVEVPGYLLCFDAVAEGGLATVVGSPNEDLLSANVAAKWHRPPRCRKSRSFRSHPHAMHHNHRGCPDPCLVRSHCGRRRGERHIAAELPGDRGRRHGLLRRRLLRRGD